MRPLLRTAYRAILHLHPQAFRAEFGEEMLWIFEEESRTGAVPRLLLDGMRSIVVQMRLPLASSRIHPARSSLPMAVIDLKSSGSSAQ